MKKLFIGVLLLVPIIAFAGGSHEKTKVEPQKVEKYTPSKTHEIAPQTPVVPQPSPTSVSAPTIPTTQPSAPQGGNGMIYCSGPLAPGWNVSLPNGGCKATTVKVPLNAMPYTGTSEELDALYLIFMCLLASCLVYFSFA